MPQLFKLVATSCLGILALGQIPFLSWYENFTGNLQIGKEMLCLSQAQSQKLSAFWNKAFIEQNRVYLFQRKGIAESFANRDGHCNGLDVFQENLLASSRNR